MATPLERIQKVAITYGNALLELGQNDLSDEAIGEFAKLVRRQMAYKIQQAADKAELDKAKQAWPITEGQARVLAHHKGITFVDAMSLGFTRAKFDKFMDEFDHVHDCPKECPVKASLLRELAA